MWRARSLKRGCQLLFPNAWEIFLGTCPQRSQRAQSGVFSHACRMAIFYYYFLHLLLLKHRYLQPSCLVLSIMLHVHDAPLHTCRSWVGYFGWDFLCQTLESKTSWLWMEDSRCRLHTRFMPSSCFTAFFVQFQIVITCQITLLVVYINGLLCYLT